MQKPYLKHKSVIMVQRLLGKKVDQIYGLNTEAAVRGFQKENGLIVDGIVRPNIWNAFV